MNNKMTAIAGIILKNERKNHKKILLFYDKKTI